MRARVNLIAPRAWPDTLTLSLRFRTFASGLGSTNAITSVQLTSRLGSSLADTASLCSAGQNPSPRLSFPVSTFPTTCLKKTRSGGPTSTRVRRAVRNVCGACSTRSGPKTTRTSRSLAMPTSCGRASRVRRLSAETVLWPVLEADSRSARSDWPPDLPHRPRPADTAHRPADKGPASLRRGARHACTLRGQKSGGRDLIRAGRCHPALPSPLYLVFLPGTLWPFSRQASLSQRSRPVCPKEAWARHEAAAMRPERGRDRYNERQLM